MAEFQQAPPRSRPVRAWAGPSREARGAGGAGLRLALSLWLGLVMLRLGGPAGLGLRPRDGERAGGCEGSASQQKVSLGKRGHLRRQVTERRVRSPPAPQVIPTCGNQTQSGPAGQGPETIKAGQVEASGRDFASCHEG